MAFFLVGAVHVALMFLAMKVAATMVAGWQVFGLVPERNAGRSGDALQALPAPAAVSSAPRSANVAPASAGLAPRRVDVAAAMPVLAANDGGPAAVSRETRVYATSGGGGQVAPLNPATSRTRGIGNRFRSAGGAAPAKMTSPEKYQ